MAKSTSRTFKIGRSAVTGKFITVARAKKNKNNAIVQTIKKRS